MDLKLTQIDRNLAGDVAKELVYIGASKSEIAEREIGAVERLQRMTIRASQAGIAQQSNVHMVRGVIKLGETLMLVVPTVDKLTIEARIASRGID